MNVAAIRWMLVAALAWALGACDRAGRPGSAAQAPSIELGRRVYDEQCAACHGRELEGQPDWRTRRADGKLPAPPHDASGHTWHHPDAVLFEIVKHGVQRFAGANYASDMPAYEGKLSDAEIRAVIAYVKSRWPEQAREYQARIDAASRK